MSLLSEKTMIRLMIGALILGTLYRLYPVVAGQPALAQFFMTEDGYLMLTIARNMAIGLGMSVSDGTIASNGVQPLATFLFAIPYVLTGGDKVTSLVGVHLISAAIAVAGIFSVRALARMILAPVDPRPLWPWLVATLWYLGPLLVLHSMNGLETGLYTLMLTLTLVMFGKLLEKGPGASTGDRLFFGAVCGVTFLARNDAVFLLTAIWLVWACHALLVQRENMVQAAGKLFVPGVLSILVASPWLINNYLGFGSIVPVSGTAQALSGGLATNAAILPAKLFEHMFPMLPIPEGIEPNPIVAAVCLGIVGAVLLIFLIGTWRRGGVARHVTIAALIASIALAVYYGLFFGAGWFLSRYLAPVAPVLLIAATALLIRLCQYISAQRVAQIGSLLGLVAIVLSLALMGRYLIPGAKEQGHFQVVGWVSENVAPDVWVGAVQTGTVGYWHDRTINLDGKVNPDALNAILTEGHVLNYVMESPVEYLADWWGIVTWATDPAPEHDELRAAFSILVDDPAGNLGVLERIR